METEEAAETAIKELNGREVKGRPMKVGSVLNVHSLVTSVQCYWSFFRVQCLILTTLYNLRN